MYWTGSLFAVATVLLRSESPPKHLIIEGLKLSSAQRTTAKSSKCWFTCYSIILVVFSSSTWNRCWNSSALMTQFNKIQAHHLLEPTDYEIRDAGYVFSVKPVCLSGFFFIRDAGICFHSSVFYFTNSITWPEVKRTFDAVCVCSSFFWSSNVCFVFCFLKSAREVFMPRCFCYCRTCSRQYGPDVCSGCKIAVAGVAHLRFGMILNQMLQVPHRKTWTLDQRKCEIFKLFFRLR